MILKNKIEYFHYLGLNDEDRYYKVDWENSKVVQIVLEKGTGNRGNTHCVGVFFINIQSFRGSYYWKLSSKKTKFLVTTKNQFDQAFGKIMNQLNG